MDHQEHKRQIGKVECSECGHAWIGHPDSSCPFCEIERLQTVKCKSCGFQVPRRWTKAAANGGRICIDATMLGCYAAGLRAEIKRLQGIVDERPKTADGVPIIPEMDVWQRETKDAGKTWSIVARRANKSFLPFPGWIGRRCYSTREAAEAEGGEDAAS